MDSGFIALQLASTDVRATTFVGLISGTTFSVIDSVRHPVARFTELPAFTALLQIMKVLSLFETTGRRIIRSLNRMSLLRPIVAPLFSHPARVDKSVIDVLATEGGAARCALRGASESLHDRIRPHRRLQRGTRLVTYRVPSASQLWRS